MSWGSQVVVVRLPVISVVGSGGCQPKANGGSVETCFPVETRMYSRVPDNMHLTNNWFKD